MNVGALLCEVVAAHEAYNRANGTSHEVVLEPNGARFGRYLKDTMCIGSTAKKAVVKQMAGELQRSDAATPAATPATGVPPPASLLLESESPLIC